MNIRKYLPHMALVAILSLVPLLITAASTGQIEGTVSHAVTGEALSGALIKIAGTNITVRSDLNGDFIIPNLSPGTYDLTATLLGFSATFVKNIRVVADATAEVDVKLTPMVAVIDDSGTNVKNPNSHEQKRPADAKKDENTNTPPDGAAMKSVSEPAKAGEESGLVKNRNERSTSKSESEKKSNMGSADLYYLPLSSPSCATGVNPASQYPPAHGGCAIVNGQAYDAMFFQNYGVNPFVDTEDDHLSTFAADVDDASYTLARSYIERGSLPPEDAIRVEEFINHFDYQYASPHRTPFAVYMEGAPSRFGQNCQLLRIGIKGMEINPHERKTANLVFVIDVSGSMAREDRLELVKRALHYLVDQLRPDDRVGIVVYGSRAQEILPLTSVGYRRDIVSAINRLQPGGSTNAEGGIRLGYRMAVNGFEEGKINRVILCSDGVANVGVTGPEDILKEIKRYADLGITLSAVGFGMGNYNDILLEKLGDKGNGHYAYVDDIAEAKRVFVDNLTGNLQVIARDVKIQVSFNPQVVRSYRLIGYENRDVADNKFRDDREDGGELGSGHQVTALYEIKLQSNYRGANIGTVSIRYKDPDSFEVSEISRSITRRMFQPRFEMASPQFRLAAATAEFAEILKKSYWAKNSSLGNVINAIAEIDEDWHCPAVEELMQLVQTAGRFQDNLAQDE